MLIDTEDRGRFCRRGEDGGHEASRRGQPAVPAERVRADERDDQGAAAAAAAAAEAAEPGDNGGLRRGNDGR